MSQNYDTTPLIHPHPHARTIQNIRYAVCVLAAAQFITSALWLYTGCQMYQNAYLGVCIVIIALSVWCYVLARRGSRMRKAWMQDEGGEERVDVEIGGVGGNEKGRMEGGEKDVGREDSG